MKGEGPAPGGTTDSLEADMAKPKRRPLTDAERQQRRAEDRQTATAAVEALKSSDGWQAWLKVRRRFHTYSLLIWGGRCQRCGGGSLCASVTCR